MTWQSKFFEFVLILCVFYRIDSLGVTFLASSDKPLTFSTHMTDLEEVRFQIWISGFVLTSWTYTYGVALPHFFWTDQTNEIIDSWDLKLRRQTFQKKLSNRGKSWIQSNSGIVWICDFLKHTSLLETRPGFVYWSYWDRIWEVWD